MDIKTVRFYYGAFGQGFEPPHLHQFRVSGIPELGKIQTSGYLLGVFFGFDRVSQVEIGLSNKQTAIQKLSQCSLQLRL